MDSPIERLPDELLLAIIAYCRGERTSHRTTQKTLRALCCTSRLWHRLATPALFEEYAPTDTVHEFAQTIVTRPDLAHHVKTLYWTLTGPEPKAAARSNDDVVVLALRSYKVDFADRAAAAIQWQHPSTMDEFLDAYLLLILMYTPNIELLHVGEGPNSSFVPSVARGWLLPISNRLPHSFRCLKSIKIEGILFADLEVLLGLPSLHALKGSTRFTAWPSVSLSWACPPIVSTLQELVLSPVTFKESELVAFIEACQELRKFVYCPERSWRFGFCTVRPFVLKAALDKHAPSLRELDIQTCSASRSLQVGNEAMKIDTFAPYRQLRRLIFPVWPLIPLNPDLFVHQLPPNLETLSLDEVCHENFGDSGRRALESLLLAPHSSLRNVNVMYLDPDFTETPSFIYGKNLRKDFGEKNIALRIWHADSDSRERAHD